MLNRLLESVDGLTLGMYSLFGRDVSPLRPGERQRGSYNPVVVDPDWRMHDNPSNAALATMRRAEQVRTFDDMDATNLASSVVDLQTEDSLMAEATSGSSITVSGLPDTKQEVESLFRRLDMQTALYTYARAALLYGGYICRLGYSKQEGITNIFKTNPERVEMVVDKNTDELIGYKEIGRTFRGGDHAVSFPHDYWHIKIPGKRQFDAYGQSILAAAVRPWCQLCIAEDMALLYRLQRQPDRLLYKIDIGSASEAEAMRAVQEMRRRTKRAAVIDPVNLRLRSQYNPIGALEDVYMGVRPNSATDISVMQGSGNVNDVTDLRYYISNFLAATRTPQAMMGMDDPLNQFRRDRRLSNQDVRYARHVASLQRAICAALLQLAKMHLALRRSHLSKVTDVESFAAMDVLRWEPDQQGRDGLVVSLPPPSVIVEMEKIELMQMRGQLALEIKNLLAGDPTANPYEWNAFILRDMLQLTEEQIARVLIDPKILQQQAQQEQELAARGQVQEHVERIAEKEYAPAVDDVRRTVEAAHLPVDRRVHFQRLLEGRPALLNRIMRLRALRSDEAAEILHA